VANTHSARTGPHAASRRRVAKPCARSSESHRSQMVCSDPDHCIRRLVLASGAEQRAATKRSGQASSASGAELHTGLRSASSAPRVCGSRSNRLVDLGRSHPRARVRVASCRRDPVDSSSFLWRLRARRESRAAAAVPPCGAVDDFARRCFTPPSRTSQMTGSP